MKTPGMVLLVATAVSPLAPPARAAEAESPVVSSAAEIKWVESPAFKGARIAVLWGDPKTGAYGAFKSMPGGTSLGLHTHSHEQRVIPLAGAVTLTLEGAAAKDLGPGSYAHIPAGVKHKADCKAGADCVWFEEQPGPSDINFVR